MKGHVLLLYLKGKQAAGGVFFFLFFSFGKLNNSIKVAGRHLRHCGPRRSDRHLGYVGRSAETVGESKGMLRAVNKYLQLTWTTAGMQEDISIWGYSTPASLPDPSYPPPSSPLSSVCGTAVFFPGLSRATVACQPVRLKLRSPSLP